MKLLALLLIVISTCCCQTATTTEGLQMPFFKPEVPAIAIRLMGQDDTLKMIDKGIRALDQNTPIASNDKWHIGSCTKTMTSYLIAKLIDQKKLQLNTNLVEIFPNVKMSAQARLITIQDLLSHRSGLQDVSEIQPFWSNSFTSHDDLRTQRNEFLNLVVNQNTHFAPGTKNQYSNAGYVVLGSILEKFYNDSWENIVQDQLFKPLKMNGCGFGPAASKNVLPPDHPIGHMLINDQLTPVHPQATETIPSDNPQFLGPAGTVHCTMESWGKFLQEMLNASLGNSSFLSSSTASTFFSEYKDSHTVGGWGILKKDWANGAIYTMVGSNTLNYAMYIVIPGKKSVVFGAVNSGTDIALKTLTTEIKNIIPK